MASGPRCRGLRRALPLATMSAPASAPAAAGIIERAAALAEMFAQTAADHDRTAAFPLANFQALFEAGLLNLTLARARGGPEAGVELAARVVDRIARGEPSTALVLAMHYIYHAVPRLTGAWDGLAYERICADAKAGVALVNVMRVEPELGTPARGGLPATTATPVPGGWRLSGHKLYATGSPALRWFITWARTAGDDPRVGWFAIPRDAQGWRIEETWDHLGMRATGSHDLLLDDVFIPAEYALELRSPKQWFPPDPVQMTWNNLVLAALYSGVARAARAWLVRYLHERVPSNLGAPLATLPRMQMAVGEIESLLLTNDRLIFGLAAEADACGYAQEHAAATAIAKSVATGNAIRAVDIALGLVGNPGLSRHHDLERHHRDVLCGRIHVPQDDMVQLAAGRAALGL